MSAGYCLRVIRVKDLRWKHALYRKEPDLYVEVKVGDDMRRTRTIRKCLNPVWDEVLLLPSVNESAILRIQAKHDSTLLPGRCIGAVEISLVDLLTRCSCGEGTLDLLPSKNVTSIGRVVLQLVPVDEMAGADTSIKAVLEDMQAGKIMHSARVADITQTTMDRADHLADQDSLYGAIGNLMSKLEVFGSVIDALSEIHPFLTVAWTLTSALYKVVENVFQTHLKIVGLVRAMNDAFSFVAEAESLPDKARSLQRPIIGLLKQIIECCLFVHKYTTQSFFRQLVDISSGEKIEEFERVLSDFRQQIDSGAILHTTFISMRTSQGINELLLRERLNPTLSDGFDRPICLPETRTEVRDQIIEWIFSNTTQNIFWLYGVAGSGKSTISMTIANHLREMSRLGALLFFERGKSEPSSVLRAIAYQLALYDSSIGSKILAETENDKSISTAPSALQFNRLLLPILSDPTATPGPVLVILDALDECGTPETRRSLMEILRREFVKLPNTFRLLITSRQEPDIDKVLSSMPAAVYAMELDCTSIASQMDVLSFLRFEMHNAVREQVQIPADWKWEESIACLGRAAGGLFIWASTAVKMVRNSDSPFYQLDCLVSDSNTLTSFALNDLYSTVLRSSGITWDSKRSRERFVKVMALLLLSRTPLSNEVVDGILDFPPQETSLLILSKLRSLLAFATGGPISLYHASFSEYLTSPDRSTDPWFIDISTAKLFIADRCFSVMSDLLRFNICDLKSSFVFNNDIPGFADRVKACVPSHLEYACLNWVHHLIELPHPSGLLDKLSQFAHRQLLFWFEVLSFRKVLTRVAPRALLDAALWVESYSKDTASFLRDASKLVSSFALPIAQSTPHIYVSMLPLSKGDSQVAVHYSRLLSSMVNVQRIGAKRPPMYLRVLEGHSDKVRAVAVAPDGRRVVSASEDQTIRIWNLDSWEEDLVLPLTSPGDIVLSVDFSPDGTRLVSGSVNGTVRVWDSQSGEDIFGPLVAHKRGIFSVAFSPDRTMIASASADRTIVIWDAAEGKPLSNPFTGHAGDVNSVAFSPDSTRLVSGSDDKTIMVWDVRSGKPVFKPLEGHLERVYSVAFSPEGDRVASGSNDKTVRTWDVKNGRSLSTFLALQGVSSVAFSPCGTRIISGHWDARIVVWCAQRGQIVSDLLKGHSGAISSVAWSRDGRYIISGSFDRTVMLWDPTSGTRNLPIIPGHGDAIRSVAFSIDGNRVASSSDDGAVIIRDSRSGEITTGPLLGHSGTVFCIAFSPDDARLVSGSNDIRVWDTKTGELAFDPLEGHQCQVFCIAVSPDGGKLASGSFDKTIRVWDLTTGKPITERLSGHSDTIFAVAFSPTGELLASGSADATIRIWNTETWEGISDPLSSHADTVSSLCFSLDGVRIAAGCGDGSIIVWDVASREMIGEPFKGHTGSVSSLIFSLDGRLVVSGSWDNTIRVWDAGNGQNVCEPLCGHIDFIMSLSLSPDGSRLVSGSADNMIRAWDVSDILRPLEKTDDNFESAPPSRDSKRCEWIMGENGWLLCGRERRELLMWIPPDLRRMLWSPRTTAIWNCSFSTKLDFTGAALGERWMECYAPR